MAKSVLNCATLAASAERPSPPAASHTPAVPATRCFRLHAPRGGSTEPQELRSSRKRPAVEDFVNTAVLLGSADELQQWSSSRGGGDGMESSLDIDEIGAELQDPEKMAEAMESSLRPGEDGEAREMMDDPDFRAMVMEALQRGGGKKVEALPAMLGDAGMAGSLQSIGPSLAQSRRPQGGPRDADEFEAAAVSLHNLLTDLEEARGAEAHRRTCLDDPWSSSKVCCSTMAASSASAARLHRGGGGGAHTTAVAASLCPPADAEGAAMEYQRAHDLIADARRDVHLAANLSATHGLPYAAAQFDRNSLSDPAAPAL